MENPASPALAALTHRGDRAPAGGGNDRADRRGCRSPGVEIDHGVLDGRCLAVRLVVLLVVLISGGCAGRPEVADAADAGAKVRAADVGDASVASVDGLGDGAAALDVDNTPALPCQWTDLKNDDPTHADGLTKRQVYEAPDVACAWDATPLTELLVAPTGALLADEHGLKGDGETDDTAALLALVAKAGKNGVVAFTGGKTYVVCRSITLLEGQRLTRTGTGEAVLKRCDERTATLTKGVAKGAFSFEVAQPNVFSVGMGLTVADPSMKGQAAVSAVLHKVTVVKGAVITVYPGLFRAFDAGAKAITAFPFILASAPGIRIDHVVFDGNRSHNDTVSFWQGNQTLIAGDNASKAVGFIVEHCVFRDQAADAISLTQCQDCKVRRCLFRDTNGSTVHFSTAANAEYAYNVALRVGAKASLAGHTEGVATWSLYVLNPWLHHNCFQDTKIRAFGRLWPQSAKAGGSVGARIDNNVMIDTPGFFWAASPHDTDAPNPIHIRDNLCVRCGRIIMASTTSGGGKLLHGPIISGNRIYGGAIDLRGVSDVSVRGNVVVAGEQAAVWAGEKIHDNFGFPLLRLEFAVDTQVDANALLGGERGAWVRKITGNNDKLYLTNNQVLDQRWVGMISGDKNHINLPTHSGSKTPGSVFSGNTVVPQLTAKSGRAAVVLGRQSTLLDTCIASPAHGVQVYGHDGTGAANETTVMGNNIRAADRAVVTPNEVGGILVKDNTVVGEFSDSLEPGPTTRVSNNTPSVVGCEPCWPLPSVFDWLPAGVPAKLGD